jgi:peptide-methionine (S)-S-oxide reductase
MNRQGNDVGTQYRSGIYYTTPEQKQVAEDMHRGRSAGQAVRPPIVTEVQPMDNYWPAEEYHQDFFEKNPTRAIAWRSRRPRWRSSARRSSVS